MRLRPFTHIPPAMVFASNGGTGEGRAQNTTATGFDVDAITIMFRGIVPNISFATMFAANHQILTSTSPLWVHVDTGNGGISMRYYRSSGRGQWFWALPFGVECVIAIQYDRSNTANKPRFWIRRVGVDKKLQEKAYNEELQTPPGGSTANTPSAGYTVSHAEFGWATRVAHVQFWNRFLNEREMEKGYHDPFSIQDGLILGLDGHGIDHSPRKQHATFAGAGAGTTYGFSSFELDEWDLEPRSIGFVAAAATGNLSAAAAMPVAGFGLLEGVGALAAAAAAPHAAASNLVATGDLAAGAAAPAAGASVLDATGALAASAAQPTAGAADLTATAHLEAAAALPAASGAELLGQADLAAGAALPQAAASNLVGLASLEAAAALPVASGANLEATVTDSMVACAAMPVTGFGLLTGVASLTASAAVPMTNLGLLIGIAALSGSSAQVLAGSGVLGDGSTPAMTGKVIRGVSPVHFQFRGQSHVHPQFRGRSPVDPEAG